MHAHMGWIFGMDGVANERRYAPELLADPLVSMDA
jgi:hypothetical protein